MPEIVNTDVRESRALWRVGLELGFHGRSEEHVIAPRSPHPRTEVIPSCATISTAKLDSARADESREFAKTLLAKAGEAPGFVSGTFARSADGSADRSIVIFETEEAAKALAERAPGLIPSDGRIELISVEVFEVVAHR